MLRTEFRALCTLNMRSTTELRAHPRHRLKLTVHWTKLEPKLWLPCLYQSNCFMDFIYFIQIKQIFKEMHWGLLAHCVVLTKSTQLSDLTLLFCKKRSESQPLQHLEILLYSIYLLLLLGFWCGKAHTTAHTWIRRDRLLPFLCGSWRPNSGLPTCTEISLTHWATLKTLYFFLKICFYFSNVCVHACVFGDMCACKCRCSWGPEESIWFPGPGVTCSCEQTDMGIKMWIPLQEQSMFLPTVQSF